MAGHVISNFLKNYIEKFEIINVARSANLNKPDILLNILEFTELEKLIHSLKPNIIINCVGLLNSIAEEKINESILLNSFLPNFLAEKTKNINCKIIHLSTDCVFSGKKGNYIESDLKDGNGIYSNTKSLGEIINNKDLTIRTSIIGPELNKNGIGLFNWFSKQNGEITGYNNVLWSGITTITLAKSILNLIKNNTTGLVHLTNNTTISKYDLLIIFNNEFKNSKVQDIKIDNKYISNKSFINTRTDLNLNIPSYSEMVVEMKNWIITNINNYKHYSSIL